MLFKNTSKWIMSICASGRGFTVYAVKAILIDVMIFFCFSHPGYFVYDFLDMIAYKKIASAWPLLLHHVVVSVLGNFINVKKTWSATSQLMRVFISDWRKILFVSSLTC